MSMAQTVNALSRAAVVTSLTNTSRTLSVRSWTKHGLPSPCSLTGGAWLGTISSLADGSPSCNTRSSTLGDACRGGAFTGNIHTRTEVGGSPAHFWWQRTVRLREVFPCPRLPAACLALPSPADFIAGSDVRSPTRF